MSTYLTDGVHLYRVLDTTDNYGLAGGVYTIVENCMTDAVRAISPLEVALCELVRASSQQVASPSRMGGFQRESAGG